MRGTKKPEEQLKQTIFNRPFTLKSIIPFFVYLSVLFFLIYVIYLQNLQIVDLQTQINLLELNLAGVVIKEKDFFI